MRPESGGEPNSRTEAVPSRLLFRSPSPARTSCPPRASWGTGWGPGMAPVSSQTRCMRSYSGPDLLFLIHLSPGNTEVIVSQFIIFKDDSVNTTRRPAHPMTFPPAAQGPRAVTAHTDSTFWGPLQCLAPCCLPSPQKKGLLPHRVFSSVQSRGRRRVQTASGDSGCRSGLARELHVDLRMQGHRWPGVFCG